MALHSTLLIFESPLSEIASRTRSHHQPNTDHHQERSEDCQESHVNGILRFCAAVVESNNLDIEVPPSAEHRRFAPVMGQDCEKELI